MFGIINLLSYADNYDRGRPSDFENHNEGPLTYIYMVVGALILLAFAGFWIYDKIIKHKKAISETLGTIFGGGIILCAMLLIGKCGESLNKAIKTNPGPNKPVIENPIPGPPKNTQPNTNKHCNKPSSSPNPAPHTRYRTVEYYETCIHCFGEGKILCPRCNGTGNIKITCSSCNGSGGHHRSRCIYCDGKGYRTDDVFGSGRQNCYTCNGTGYVENTCIRCQGSGYEYKTCDVYAAAGLNKHYVTCTYCNGTGKIRKTRQESYQELFD